LSLFSGFLLLGGEVQVDQHSARATNALVPLPLKLPFETVLDPVISLSDLPSGPDIEPRTLSRPPFLVPAGITNVALSKKVTASENPFNGSLSLITDGEKEAFRRCVAEFRKGVHWVQIDLGAEYDIHAVVFWLDHTFIGGIYRGVVVAVTDDELFGRNVRVLFNNDKENSAGLGAGADRRFFETNLGKLVDAKGAKARYVRVYSNGSDGSPLNMFTEVEVWALPAK
jgi:hypothetical protein